MQEHLLLGLTAVVALGVSAQWLAWRLGLPSILLLLGFGFCAGPMLRWLGADTALDPDRLFGDLLLPVVSISVAVILYEGGLTLSLRELPKVGGVVRNLVTVGLLITWLLGAAAANLCLGLSWRVALLLGAVLVVSGPTVIMPMLRHVRPAGSVGPIVKWEGIVIDPLGAMLAVLVFEAAFAGAGHKISSIAILGVVRTLLIGGALGAAAGFLLALLVRRHGVPDFLHNAVSLMLVTGVFVGVNHLQSESGLVAVTVMGLVLANQRLADVRHIIDFKENLRVLLISVLFILLAARLRLEDLAQLGGNSLLLVALLIVVVRPVATFVSTLGSKLSWRERVFLAWMAPRGIVAAAVASIFALRLEGSCDEARLIVPLTFLVIVATVAVYGLTARPLARWLGIADVNPQGVLIVGAPPWARALAETLQRSRVPVLLVDRNRTFAAAARMAGCRVYAGDALGEHVLAELDLRGIGRLLALTPNDEVNALAVQRFERVFGRANAFQLPPAKGVGDARTVPTGLRGRLLFGRQLTYADLSERYFGRGYVFRSTSITESFGYEEIRERYGDSVVPMFVLRADGCLTVITDDQEPNPRPGDALISLAPPDKEPSGTGE